MLDEMRTSGARQLKTLALTLFLGGVILVIPAIALIEQQGPWPLVVPLALAIGAVVAFVAGPALCVLSDQAVMDAARWQGYRRYLKQIASEPRRQSADGRASAHAGVRCRARTGSAMVAVSETARVGRSAMVRVDDAGPVGCLSVVRVLRRPRRGERAPAARARAPRRRAAGIRCRLRRRRTAGESAEPQRALETLGTVPQRARLGHGPRGLQRRRRRLAILPARPRPLARLPLERGRPRRHLRPPSAHLLRARAVERPRPDPQGAALRPDRPAGQPRRGRQGVLLLSRQHADALLHEVAATSTRRRRSRTRSSSRRTRAADAQRPGVRAARHRRLRRRSLLRRVRRVREGRARRHPDPDHGREPRSRGRRRSTCCRRSGSAIAGRGRRATTRPVAVARRRPRRRATRRSSTSGVRPALSVLRRVRRSCSSPKTRPTRAAALRHAERDAVREGRHQRLRRPRQRRRPSIPPAPARNAPRATALTIPAGGRAVLPPAAHRHAARRRRSARPSTAVFDDRIAEADEFYADGHPRRPAATTART